MGDEAKGARQGEDNGATELRLIATDYTPQRFFTGTSTKDYAGSLGSARGSGLIVTQGYGADGWQFSCAGVRALLLLQALR
jgi:hypothetical protein